MSSLNVHPFDGSARATREQSRAGRNLLAAIGTGVLLAVLFLATIFTNAWGFLVFVGAIVVIGTLELNAALRARGMQPAFWIIASTGLVALFGAYVYGSIAQVMAAALLVFGAVGWVSANRGDRNQLQSLSATLLAGLWLPFLASFVALLLRRDPGHLYVLATIVLTVANDIGAYAVGSLLGRHKLAPIISPGKTWEGLFGGLAAVLLVGAAIPVVLPEMPMLLALGLGVLVAGMASLGDLAASVVKRSLGMKDLGHILPGHGGIMDRIDGMLFALPVAHLVLLIRGI